MKKKEAVTALTLLVTLILATAAPGTTAMKTESREAIKTSYDESSQSAVVGAIVDVSYVRLGIVTAIAYADVDTAGTITVQGGTFIKIVGCGSVIDQRHTRFVPYSVYLSVSPGRSIRFVVMPAINRTGGFPIIPLGGHIIAPLREGTYHYTITGQVAGPHASAFDTGVLTVVVNNSDNNPEDNGPNMDSGPNEQIDDTIHFHSTQPASCTVIDKRKIY